MTPAKRHALWLDHIQGLHLAIEAARELGRGGERVTSVGQLERMRLAAEDHARGVLETIVEPEVWP